MEENCFNVLMTTSETRSGTMPSDVRLRAFPLDQLVRMRPPDFPSSVQCHSKFYPEQVGKMKK